MLPVPTRSYPRNSGDFINMGIRGILTHTLVAIVACGAGAWLVSSRIDHGPELTATDPVGRLIEIHHLADPAERARALVDFFAEAVEKGEIETAKPEDLALFLGTFLHGLLISQIFATTRAHEFKDHLAELWGFFWQGISGRKPQMELEQ